MYIFLYELLERSTLKFDQSCNGNVGLPAICEHSQGGSEQDMRRAYILHIVIGGLSFFTFSPLHIFLTIKRPGTITLLKDSIVFQVTYVFLTLHSADYCSKELSIQYLSVLYLFSCKQCYIFETRMVTIINIIEQQTQGLRQCPIFSLPCS